MKGKFIAALSCLSICATLLVIYRAIPQLPTAAEAQLTGQLPSPNSTIPTIPCYPKQYRLPSLIRKSVVGAKEYSFVLATLTYRIDSPQYVQELIFEQDLIKKSCKQHNFGVEPFSNFLPEQVAVEFKEERWKQTLQQIGAKNFNNLLNTPPELPDPFYFYEEDVKALAQLGFKPGPRAKIIKSQRDLDYLYKFDE